MQRIARSSPLLVVIFVFALALPQFAFAQRLKPIPHPIGVMQHPDTQAATQASPEAHAQVRAAASTASASPWTPLTNQPNFLLDGASNPILLTDGSVLIQDTAFPDWWKLTPDKFGSYVNGTWSQVASLPATYSPLYHSSAVLPDGRLIIEGGEYLLNADQTALIPTWTPQGSIYDPVANTWTPVAPPPFFTGFGSHPQTIGDAQSIVLPNGTYMQANCCTVEEALLDAKTLTWTQTGSNKFDINDEEGWTLLPNGRVLTVDPTFRSAFPIFLTEQIQKFTILIMANGRALAARLSSSGIPTQPAVDLPPTRRLRSVPQFCVLTEPFSTLDRILARARLATPLSTIQPTGNGRLVLSSRLRTILPMVRRPLSRTARFSCLRVLVSELLRPRSLNGMGIA
jgi:hypothetical protein